MHPEVFGAFEALCAAHGAGGDVLEIGATPTLDTLLLLPSLAGARSRTGVSLEGPSEAAGFPIRRGDATRLDAWADASYDTLLCNSVLEHVARFWCVLGEVRRLARPGALVLYGVPGFAEPPRSAWRRLLRRLGRLPVVGPTLRPLAEPLLAATPTLVVHRFPGDYYRFGEQACREVLLEGLEPLDVRRLLAPPRFVVVGRRPV